jgi:hypothetical protein
VLSSGPCRRLAATPSIRDSEGMTHAVRVQGSSLFEAAARAVAAFRELESAAEALTPAAVLRVEASCAPSFTTCL